MRFHTAGVAGSIPAAPTIFSFISMCCRGACKTSKSFLLPPAKVIRHIGQLQNLRLLAFKAFNAVTAVMFRQGALGVIIRAYHLVPLSILILALLIHGGDRDALTVFEG